MVNALMKCLSAANTISWFDHAKLITMHVVHGKHFLSKKCFKITRKIGEKCPCSWMYGVDHAL